MRSFRHICCCLLSSALVAVRAQAELNTGILGTLVTDSAFSASQVCNKTFADVNATGIYSIDTQIGQGGTGASSSISWAATAYQPPANTPNATTQLSLWFSPGSANFTNNFQLGYDACYFWVKSPTINTFERGQTDNGDCLTMLDAPCVNALTSATNQYAVQVVGIPTNLSTNSLPSVCSNIASLLTENFPQECDVFYNSTRTVFGGPPALGGALTGNQSLVDRSQCHLSDNKTGNNFSLMWSQFGPSDAFNFDLATYFVTPFLTAFMPIADVNRPSTLSGAKSFMTCVRPRTLNAGSEAVPPAPSPTSLDSSNTTGGNGTSPQNSTSPSTSTSRAGGGKRKSQGLSGGAIAGVVIGVILGVSLLCALLFFIFRKRIAASKGKSVRSEETAELAGGSMHYKEAAGRSLSEAPDTAVSELSAGHVQDTAYAQRSPAELDGRVIAERGDRW